MKSIITSGAKALPFSHGDIFLNQFLRIKLASEMLADGQAQSGTKALRAQLEQGESIEIGGNLLCPDMVEMKNRDVSCCSYKPLNLKIAVTWTLGANLFA